MSQPSNALVLDGDQANADRRRGFAAAREIERARGPKSAGFFYTLSLKGRGKGPAATSPWEG